MEAIKIDSEIRLPKSGVGDMREIEACLNIPVFIYPVSKVRYEPGIIIQMTAHGIVERVPGGISFKVFSDIPQTESKFYGPFQLLASNDRVLDIGVNTETLTINGVYPIIRVDKSKAYQRIMPAFMPVLSPISLLDEVDFENG